MQPASSTILQTATGPHPLDLKLADSFFSRFRGLMLSRPLQPSQGLLLLRCPSVHCAFMLYSIDVVYLDRFGTVTKCVPRLKPWRASAGNWGEDTQGNSYSRAAHALELAAGMIDAFHICAGDRLHHPRLQAGAAMQAPPSILSNDESRTTP